MGLSKIYSVLLFFVVILFLQEQIDGKSISHTEEEKTLGSKVKNFLERATIEIGYRVGALELPEERRGLNTSLSISTTSNPVDVLENQEERGRLRSPLPSINIVNGVRAQDEREGLRTNLPSNNNVDRVETVRNQGRRRLPCIYFWKHR